MMDVYSNHRQNFATTNLQKCKETTASLKNEIRIENQKAKKRFAD